MASCNESVPLGQYGSDVYGDGISPCDSKNPVGYGDGVGACVQPEVGDPCLVGTVTKLATSIWVGHRVQKYGGGTYQATNYPECKRLVQQCVNVDLREDRVEEPGRPLIVYLRLLSCGVPV